jgi:hypothetical protein
MPSKPLNLLLGVEEATIEAESRASFDTTLTGHKHAMATISCWKHGQRERRRRCRSAVEERLVENRTFGSDDGVDVGRF